MADTTNPLDAAALAIASTATPKVAKIDPLLIAALIQAIVAIIQACRKDSVELRDAARKRNLLHRLVVRRRIRNALDDRKRKDDVDVLTAAAFKVASEAKLEDLDRCVIAVGDRG